MAFRKSMTNAEIEALSAKVDGRPRAMLALARHLDGAEAAALVERALALAPRQEEIALLGREIVSALAPNWHFLIVRDQVRNEAYEAALRRAIRPGCKVLEIGAGTGLLAMMAARAGAGEVISCEANPAVAAVARDIVAANGFAGRIRILAKHSSDIDLEADLGGRADVLVSELISNNLLGQGVLPVMEHVIPAFMKPGAPVIPARGRIRVALAEDRHWRKLRMRPVSGFDLSAFDLFAPPIREMSIADPRLRLRSRAADLFNFDFASGGLFGEAAAQLALRSAGGRVNGVAQWIALNLDGSGAYENEPGQGRLSCWAVVFHRFEAPIDTEVGEEVRLCARHDQEYVKIWLATAR